MAGSGVRALLGPCTYWFRYWADVRVRGRSSAGLSAGWVSFLSSHLNFKFTSRIDTIGFQIFYYGSERSRQLLKIFSKRFDIWSAVKSKAFAFCPVFSARF